MGSFFSALIGGYANQMLRKQDLERQEQQNEVKSKLAILTSAASNPSFNWSDPSKVSALTDQLNDTLGVGSGKGKGGKSGGGERLKNILTTIGQRMRGNVATPSSLRTPLNLQGMMMTPAQQGTAAGQAQGSEAATKARQLLDNLKQTGFYKNLTPQERTQLEQTVTESAYGVRPTATKPTPQTPIEAATEYYGHRPSVKELADYESAAHGKESAPVKPSAQTPMEAATQFYGHRPSLKELSDYEASARGQFGKPAKPPAAAKVPAAITSSVTTLRSEIGRQESEIASLQSQANKAKQGGIMQGIEGTLFGNSPTTPAQLNNQIAQKQAHLASMQAAMQVLESASADPSSLSPAKTKQIIDQVNAMTSGTAQTTTMAQVQQYAKKNNLSISDALAEVRREGYRVTP